MATAAGSSAGGPLVQPSAAGLRRISHARHRALVIPGAGMEWARPRCAPDADRDGRHGTGRGCAGAAGRARGTRGVPLRHCRPRPEHLLAHWRLILGLAGAALAGALAFAWSGLYSVAASTGHYPFFRQFLAFALHQSVETHSAGIQVPPLDDPAMVQRGAGHYQGGCAPCHGAPGQERNPVTQRMLPEPPYLADVLGR